MTDADRARAWELADRIAARGSSDSDVVLIVAALRAHGASGWAPIELAPDDETPRLVLCDEIARDGDAPPGIARRTTVAWRLNPGSGDNLWVSAEITTEMYSGPEWTGSWVEHYHKPVRPTHWLPIPEPVAET